MLMKKIIKGMAITGAALLLMGSSALAGSSYEQYSLVVGKFNGSSFSYSQTKATGGADGYIDSYEVGGSYKVDVRMESDDGNGSWLRNVTDGTNKAIPGTSKQKKGCSVRAEFSNDITTPVDVLVIGEWKSN